MRGVIAAARVLRVPAAFAGATLAAFATSAPELGVAVLAAREGVPQLGLGNALGANVVNLSLTLGIALLFGGMRADQAVGPLRFGALFAAPVLAGALLLDGRLSRSDGLALLAGFAAWLYLECRQIAAREPGPSLRSELPAFITGAAGLLLLFLAAELLVWSSEQIARRWAIDAYLVGATLVALGTTVPELATAIAARLRGHHELGVATLLGSNLFNGLFITGTAAVIEPIAVDPSEAGVALAAAWLLAFGVIRRGHANVGPGRGVVLLCGYAVYLGAALKIGL